MFGAPKNQKYVMWHNTEVLQPVPQECSMLYRTAMFVSRVVHIIHFSFFYRRNKLNLLFYLKGSSNY